MANRFALAGSGSKFKEEGADPAGFLAGFWHGMIAPIAFFVSLFKPEVNIYETHNNGARYNFGFVLGVSGLFRGPNVNVNKPKKAAPEAEEEESA